MNIAIPFLRSARPYQLNLILHNIIFHLGKANYGSVSMAFFLKQNSECISVMVKKEREKKGNCYQCRGYNIINGKSR